MLSACEGPVARTLGDRRGGVAVAPSFTIAPEIAAERIAADYRESVLIVYQPKQDEAKPKPIAARLSGSDASSRSTGESH